jgi:Ca-activated chloride channel family protein
LILDSSGSMNELLGRETKLQVAQGVVNDLIDALPDGAGLGLRLYGHWGRLLLRRDDAKAPLLPEDDPRLDTDSELVMPIRPLSAAHRKSLKAWVEWAQPRGKTPLVYSLRQAKHDFPDVWKGPKTVILVSDGIETCGGKISDLTADYGESDVQAIIHVVGFDIRGVEAEKQLREIAAIGHGRYFAAADAAQLAEGLKSAVAAGTLVVQHVDSNTEVARGVINGAPLVLGPGVYRVSLVGVQTDPLLVTISDGDMLQPTLSEEGQLTLD